MDVLSKSKVVPSSNGHSCEYCNKTFTTKYALKAHKNIHLGEKPFKCTFCDYFAIQQSTLERHIRTHTREKPYRCPHPNCPLSSATKDELKRHQIVHCKEDPNLPTFQCPEPGCSFKTIWKCSISKHLTIHSDDRPFHCSLCSYQTRLKGDLVHHRNNVHTVEKKVKCPQLGCLYLCKRKCQLIQHMPVHSDDRPFACFLQGCSFRSKTKRNLKSHEMIHRGEKPFKCSFCPYSSHNRSELVVHTRVHTGETPYSCKVCSYRGKTASKLTRHVKAVHSGKKKWVRSKPKEEKTLQVQGSVFNCRVLFCTFSTMEESSLAFHFNAAHNLPRVIMQP